MEVLVNKGLTLEMFKIFVKKLDVVEAKSDPEICY